VVDKQSQESKLQQMQNRIAELEQAVGHKQMQIDFYQKYLEIASEYMDDDVKKKFDTARMNGSLSTNKPLPGR